LSIEKNWRELLKPNVVNMEAGSDPMKKSTLVVEPLERGYGITLGKKFKLKNPRFGLELFIGFGSSQSNYKYYNGDEVRDFENDRAFSKSGEELPYKGGLMLTYKL